MFLPEFKKTGGYRKQDYIDRNEKIVEESNYVVAFWDGKSPGTADTRRKARKAKKLAPESWVEDVLARPLPETFSLEPPPGKREKNIDQ